MDHLGPDLGLVVALHLYGIDKLPYKGVQLQDQITKHLGPKDGVKVYTRDNFYLLSRCMDLGVPLLAWGDQPWYKAQSKLDLTEEYFPTRLVLYEPNNVVVSA